MLGLYNLLWIFKLFKTGISQNSYFKKKLFKEMQGEISENGLAENSDSLLENEMISILRSSPLMCRSEAAIVRYHIRIPEILIKFFHDAVSTLCSYLVNFPLICRND